MVTAWVAGGQEPYTYAWSDPSLSGMGTHQLCPDQDVNLVVDVQDSSASHGEFPTPPRRGQATAFLDAGSTCDGEGGESCYCAPQSGSNVIASMLFNDPVPGTTFTVCNGSPTARLDMWQWLTGAPNTHYIELHEGESIEVPLLEPIQPGQPYWYLPSWANHGTGALRLETAAGDGSCGPIGLPLIDALDASELGLSCNITFNTSSEPIRYIRLTARPNPTATPPDTTLSVTDARMALGACTDEPPPPTPIDTDAGTDAGTHASADAGAAF